jgi:hypothetical protein
LCNRRLRCHAKAVPYIDPWNAALLRFLASEETLFSIQIVMIGQTKKNHWDIACAKHNVLVSSSAYDRCAIGCGGLSYHNPAAILHDPKRNLMEEPRSNIRTVGWDIYP